MNAPALLDFNRSQLAIIRQTCAKDCSDSEFSFFVELCKARGLNPLLKHIYAMVLNKDQRKDSKGNPIGKPRQLVTIVSVDGQRVIANRTRNYRPDDRPPRFEFDDAAKDEATNPTGLVSAEVAVYVHSHEAWHKVPALVWYEEYAPIIDEWKEDPADGKRKSTGRRILDPSKPNWRKMPRLLLAKVAEVAALRKAFPDDFGGLYGEEEMDRSHSLDLTASEILAEAAKEHRMDLIGGPGYIVDWMAGGPLEKVPSGQFYDRSLAWLRQVQGSPLTIKAWEDRNRYVLREFWAHSKGDADALKREVEKAKILTVEPDADQQ